MSTTELDHESTEIADTICRSFDGRTEQQRFYELTVEPRIQWASQLAIWDGIEPQTIRGLE